MGEGGKGGEADGAMKILVLCYEYPPVGGGGGRVAASVAQELVARGHEVRFLTGNAGCHPLEFEEGGVKVKRVNAPRRLPDTCSVKEMLLYVLWSILPGWRLVRKWKPDVIHAHFAVPTGAVAWVLSVLTGVPYVLTVHLGDVPGGVPEQTAGLFRVVKPFTVPIWKRASRISAVSRFVKNLAVAAYNAEPVVIHNGLAFSKKEKSALSVPKNEVRFLFVGRISVQKNLMLALQAFARVGAEHWRFDVVGDGPLRREAEAFVSEQRMGERVFFHGWLGKEPLSRLRAESQVLLMPSLHEGLPMAAVEALADGLAIVGSSIPGLADVLEDGKNGFALPLEPEAFAGAIEKILGGSKELETMREESLRKAADFRMEGIIDQYESLLKLR